MASTFFFQGLRPSGVSQKPSQSVSWTAHSHLSGLIVGFVFALIFRKSIAKPEKYSWEQLDYDEEDDPFMRHFDEDGNFIEHIDKDKEDQEETNKINVNYIFKKKDN